MFWWLGEGAVVADLLVVAAGLVQWCFTMGINLQLERHILLQWDQEETVHLQQEQLEVTVKYLTLLIFSLQRGVEMVEVTLHAPLLVEVKVVLAEVPGIVPLQLQVVEVQ